MVMPNMPSKVPARRMADALRDQAERRSEAASSSRKINHSTVTRPGGVRVVGGGSIESEAADGTATRLAAGVLEQRPTPDDPWEPLESGGGLNPVAPSESPEVTATGGPGSLVLSWPRVADQGDAGVTYDVHDVTDSGDVADGSTRIGSTTSTAWFITPANGARRYRVWAHSVGLYAPEPSEVVEGAPDKDASEILVANEFYAAEGIHAGDSGGAGLDFDLQKGFLQRGPDGQPVLAFPITGVGNFFKGDLTVDSARAQKFVFLGRENLVVRNGRLMLASSIEAPPAPTVLIDYPRYERSDPAQFSTQIREPYWEKDAGDERHFLALIGTTPARIIWNRVTNVVTREFVAGWNGATGYSTAFIGDTIYYLTRGSGSDNIRSRNLTTGATTVASRFNNNPAQGIFARDGVLYWWRQTASTGSTSTLDVFTLDAATGAVTLSTSTSLPFPASGSTIVTNVRAGRFGGAAGTTRFMVTYGPGGNRSTLLIRSGSDQSIYPLPASEFADAHPFWSAPDDGSSATMLVTGGLFASSAAFVSLDLAMSGFQGPVEFATTWARGDARTYETEAGPSVVRTIPAGCRLRVDPGQWPPESDPPASTDVNRVVVYYAGVLGRWKRVAPWATRNQPVPVPTISDALGSTPPPGTSTFPADIGTPGVLASATGGLAFYGNGKAEVNRAPVDPADVVNLGHLEEGWAGPRLDYRSYSIWGTADHMDLRRMGKLREIRVRVRGTLPPGSATISAPLPAIDRPSQVVFQVLFMGNGDIGAAFIRANGELAITNPRGSSAAGAHQFSLTYTVD